MHHRSTFQLELKYPTGSDNGMMGQIHLVYRHIGWFTNIGLNRRYIQPRNFAIHNGDRLPASLLHFNLIHPRMESTSPFRALARLKVLLQ